MNFDEYKKFHNYKRDNCPVCGSEQKNNGHAMNFLQPMSAKNVALFS
jgi:hypothetical protein